LVLIYDDRIDLLIRERWPARHTDFANRGSNAHDTNGAWWKKQSLLIVVSLGRQEALRCNVARSAINIGWREKWVFSAEEFGPRARRGLTSDDATQVTNLDRTECNHHHTPRIPATFAEIVSSNARACAFS